MILFFDTETTGLPKNWKAPMQEVDNWPRVIELAWAIGNLENGILEERKYLIKPDGWVIPTEPFWIEHGFMTAISEKEGQPIQDVLMSFLIDLEACDFIVSHNMDFDHKVLGAEMIRLGLSSKKKPAKICTKEIGTDFCKIPFGADKRPWMNKGRGYKWPKLDELYKKLFGSGFENAHSAGGDVAALARCFYEMVRLNVIKLELETKGTD